MPAGHAKLDGHSIDAEAGAQRQKLHLGRGQLSLTDPVGHGGVERRQVDLLPADALRGGRGELDEGPLELAQRAERGVVVELDVGHHRHLGHELEEGAIRLVRLDHHPLPPPPGGVRAGRAQLPADQERGVSAALPQGVSRHPRRGGLAMGAGDRDAAPQPRDLAQQVPAVQYRKAALAGRGQLGVVLGDRRGHHHLARLGQVRGVMADRGFDPVLAQAPAVGGVGAIGAADVGAQRPRHQREAAHSRAADPDEVEPPVHEGCLVHRIESSP